MFILSYVKGTIQLCALILHRRKFLDLIKSAEVNFFMNGKPLTHKVLPTVESYMQTANRLTHFMWVTFVLTLSSSYYELIPTNSVEMENDATEFDDQVIGRRKTAYKVWTPFQKLNSPYLTLDIIYEVITICIFFIIFTAFNLLTLILIIFFAGHFNVLAEYIGNLTDKTDQATNTGMGPSSLIKFYEPLR